MSEIKPPLPNLSISTLKKLRSSIVLASGGEGWMLSNRLSEDANLVDHLSEFVTTVKARYQCDCIVDKVEKLFQMISDFAVRNFQPHLDKYNQYADDSTPDFDPFTELEYLMTTDGINDLPDSIERFYDLTYFAMTAGDRERAMEEAFEQFFGGKLRMHYQCKDENGESVFIPEDQMPREAVEEIKLNREVKKERDSIEIEFCLDNYDAWHAELTRLIAERRPFSEMLPLFKA